MMPSRPAVDVPISFVFSRPEFYRGLPPNRALGAGHPGKGENPSTKLSRCTQSTFFSFPKVTFSNTPDPHDLLRVILYCVGSPFSGPQSCINEFMEYPLQGLASVQPQRAYAAL